MDIGQILRHFEKTGIKTVEQVESNDDTETSWVVTERYGSKTNFHVSQTPRENDECLITGHHVYL